MSMFTEQFGQFGGGGAARTGELLKLIEAYNELSTKLSSHMAKTYADTESATTNTGNVHGIKAPLDKLTDDLSSLKQSLETYKEKLSGENGALSKLDSSESVDSKLQILKGEIGYSPTDKFAHASDLENYVTNSKYDSQVKDIVEQARKDINDDVDVLKERWAELYGHIDFGTETLLKKAVDVAEHIRAELHAVVLIDFTSWADVSAQYAGTGARHYNGNNGMYLLGRVSDIWDDNTNKPDKGDKEVLTKSFRVHVKYVNSSPFDSIVDGTVSFDGSEWYGKVTQLTSRSNTPDEHDNKPWHNLTYHIVRGTVHDGLEGIYLAISADSLAISDSKYANLHFWVSGVNFIPLDNEHGGSGKAPRITGVVHEICFNDIDNLIIGEDARDHIIFAKRPHLPIQDPNDKEGTATADFATVGDLKATMLPVGAIVEWPHFDTKTKADVLNTTLLNALSEAYGELWDTLPDNAIVSNFATDVPDGWSACDGSEFDIAKFDDLAQVLPDGHLPVRDFSIIRMTSWDNVFVQDGIGLDDIYSNESILNRLIAEENKRQLEDDRLDGRIDKEIDDRNIAIRESVEAEAYIRKHYDDKLDKAIQVEMHQRMQDDNALDSRLNERISTVKTELEKADADEKSAREEAAKKLTSAVEAEAQEREAEDRRIEGSLNAAVEAEAQEREAEDRRIEGSLNAAIEAEAQEREEQDTVLKNRITLEESIRKSDDDALRSAISREVRDREDADAVLDNKIDSTKRSLTQKIDLDIAKEADARTEADTELMVKLSEEKRDRKSEDAKLTTAINEASNSAGALKTAIEEEAETRKHDDTVLNNAIKTERQQRKDGDSSLDVRITAVEGIDLKTIRTDLNNEMKARQGADDALDARITTLESSGGSDPALEARVTAAENDIVQERLGRLNGDNNLSAQIAQVDNKLTTHIAGGGA